MRQIPFPKRRVWVATGLIAVSRIHHLVPPVFFIGQSLEMSPDRGYLGAPHMRHNLGYLVSALLSELFKETYRC